VRVRLGDVCKKGSSNIAQKDLEGHGGEYPIYGASGLIANVDFYQQEHPCIAVVKDGAGVGRVMKLPAKSSVIGTMQYILPNNNVDIGYLAYAMEYMNLAKYYTGATIPHIYFRDYQDEEIPLPSLDEQRRIAAILDKVTSLIALRKQQLTKLDELVKARFVEMFGDPMTSPMKWEYKPIKEVCCSIYGGGTPSKNHPEYFKGTIPWVSPKDMKSLIVEDTLDHITKEAISNSTTKLVPPMSVLVVIRSGILKHTLPVAINTIPVTINQDMKAFVPSKSVMPAYLLYYFKLIESDILSGVRGVTADNIDFKEFQRRSLFIPPINQQIFFSNYFNKVLDISLTIRQNLDILVLFKKSLAQDFFRKWVKV
jgi:type I restriction enzyme S subunit